MHTHTFSEKATEMHPTSYNLVTSMRFWSVLVSFLLISNTLPSKCVLGTVTISREIASHVVEREIRELACKTTDQVESLQFHEIHPVEKDVQPSFKQSEGLGWKMSREDDSLIGKIKSVAPLASPNQDDASLIDSIAVAVELFKAINFEEISAWEDGKRLRRILRGIANTQVEMTDKYGAYSNAVKKHLKMRLSKENQVMCQLLEGIWDSYAQWAYAHFAPLDTNQIKDLKMYIGSIKSYSQSLKNDKWGEGTSKRNKIVSDVVEALDKQHLLEDTDVGKDLAGAEKAMLSKLNKLQLDRTVECSSVRSRLEKIQQILRRSGLLSTLKSDYTVEQYEKARAIRTLRSEIIHFIEKQNIYILHKSMKDLQHLNFVQPQWKLNMEVLEIEKMSNSNKEHAFEALEHFGQINWHKIRDDVQKEVKKKNGNPWISRAKLIWQSSRIIRRFSLPEANSSHGSWQRCTCKKDPRVLVKNQDYYLTI